MNNEQVKLAFPSGSTWYYIDKVGIIKSFIIHSRLSPLSASTLAKVHTLHKTWTALMKL